MATEWSEDIVVVDLADEPALSEELLDAIDRVSAGPDGQVPHIVLNFGGVTYVNSSNLADLVRLRKGLAGRGRHLRLCSMCEDVLQVMSVTGLEKILKPFAPDPLTALATLQMEDSGPG
jgi:anti-anti-sigma factor